MELELYSVDAGIEVKMTNADIYTDRVRMTDGAELKPKTYYADLNSLPPAISVELSKIKKEIEERYQRCIQLMTTHCVAEQDKVDEGEDLCEQKTVAA